MLTDEDIVEQMLDDPGLKYVLFQVVRESLTPMMVSRLLDTVRENVVKELKQKAMEDLNDDGHEQE